MDAESKTKKEQDMDNEMSFTVSDVDEYLKVVGEFGKMQIILQMMNCFMILITTYQILLIVFVGINPAWKCTGLNAECNNTNDVFDENDLGYKKRCQLKNRSSWEFTEPKKFSIVTEWDLVCDREVYVHFANSAIFIGGMMSALVCGYLSDRFGRKRVLFPSTLITIIIGFVSAFTQELWQFLFLRCFIGIFQQGAVMTIFTSVTEMVGPRYRALSGTLIWFAYTLALCLVDLQAWFVRDWRLLEIIVTAPYLIFMIFWKWLRVNDKLKEAEEILKKTARINGKIISNIKLCKEIKQVHRSTFLDILWPWSRCKSTMVQCFAWFSTALVYFGVSIASGDLSGNIYRDFFLTSLVEVPANFSAIYLANRLGRKPSAILSMFFAGISCIIIAAIPNSIASNAGYKWSRVAFGMAGKLCIAVSFDVLYVWSAELYPTVVRTQGIGMMYIAGAVGGSTSPWIAKWLGNFYAALPFAVMGGCSVIAALLCVMLKETRDMKTIEVFETNKPFRGRVENCSKITEDTALLKHTYF